MATSAVHNSDLTTNTAGKPIGFWLVPADPHKQAWAKLISQLAEDKGAPVFDPHITLQAGARSSTVDVPAFLHEVAARISPVELPVLCVDHGKAYFKSVFARFPTEPLSAMSAALGVAMAEPAAYVLDAHLSLLYASLDLAERERLCKSISLPSEHIVFNRIVSVEAGVGEKDFSKVELWRQTGSELLRG